MKKYLFLDFDGVCNRVGDGSYMSYAETGRYGLSTYCCTQIRRICEETGAKIIISSNWRKFDDDGYWIYNGVKFNNPIRQIDGILGEFIVGTLPKIRHANKYVALIEWFKKNNIEFNDIKASCYYINRYSHISDFVSMQKVFDNNILGYDSFRLLKL